jgi:hypothetical protein
VTGNGSALSGGHEGPAADHDVQLATTKKSTTDPKPSTAKKAQRTADERVAALEAEIERVRMREATKELRADPGVKATSAAVRAVNKALGVAADPELTEALIAAHTALAGYLKAKGLRVPMPGKKRDSAPTAG